MKIKLLGEDLLASLDDCFYLFYAQKTWKDFVLDRRSGEHSVQWVKQSSRRGKDWRNGQWDK